MSRLLLLLLRKRGPSQSHGFPSPPQSAMSSVRIRSRCRARRWWRSSQDKRSSFAYAVCTKGLLLRHARLPTVPTCVLVHAACPLNLLTMRTCLCPLFLRVAWHSGTSPKDADALFCYECGSRVLPAGWERMTDPKSGKTYYRNYELQKTQWDSPMPACNHGTAQETKAQIDVDESTTSPLKIQKPQNHEPLPRQMLGQTRETCGACGVFVITICAVHAPTEFAMLACS